MVPGEIEFVSRYPVRSVPISKCFYPDCEINLSLSGSIVIHIEYDTFVGTEISCPTQLYATKNKASANFGMHRLPKGLNIVREWARGDLCLGCICAPLESKNPRKQQLYYCLSLPEQRGHLVTQG